MRILPSTAVRFSAPAHAFQSERVFSVNPNIESDVALYVAADLISSVTDLVSEAAVGGTPLEGNSAVMVSHTLESARAIIISVLGTMEKIKTLTPKA